MRESSLAFTLVGLVVASTVVASGPLVPALDLTPAPGTVGAEPDPGSGNVSVESVSLDGEFALARSSYGSGDYVLLIPDAVVTISPVAGEPIITYRIKVGALGLGRSSVAFLSTDEKRRQVLSMDKKSVSPEAVDRDGFDIEVRVTVRDEDGSREVFNESVVAPVRGRS